MIRQPRPYPELPCLIGQGKAFSEKSGAKGSRTLDLVIANDAL